MPQSDGSLNLLADFTALFSCRLSSLIRHSEGGKWFEMSRFHYLSDKEIVAAISGNGKTARAFRFDEKTRFAVLKISKESSYHSSEKISQLKNSLSSIALNPRHYQIEGDWYLYCFFTEFVDSDRISNALKIYLQSNGFQTGSNHIEVHPSGDFLPFPLQKSFCWLNERCQLLVRRDELNLESAVGFFLDDARQALFAPDELIQKMEAEQILVQTTSDPRIISFSRRQTLAQSNFAPDEDEESLADLLFEPEQDTQAEITCQDRYFDSQDLLAIQDEIECSGSRLVVFSEAESDPAETTQTVTTTEPTKANQESMENQSRNSETDSGSQLLLFPAANSKTQKTSEIESTNQNAQKTNTQERQKNRKKKRRGRS